MNLYSVLYALLWPPLWATVTAVTVIGRLLLPTRPPVRLRFALGWWAAGGGVVIGYLITLDWPIAGIGAAQAAFGAWLWWRSRRRRKRAPRAYGAKSRALVAALVRKARETAKPRPVLRPVPQGSPS